MALFRTHRNVAALFCRVALAAVFIPHGMDKLVRYEPFGWSGPEAWTQEFVSLLSTNVIPEQYKLILAQVSAWVEIVAAASCVFGLLVRAAMIPLLVNLGAAIALVTAKNGFWFNHRLDGIPAPGFEYHMVLILVCLGLLFSGAGSFSLDKLIGGDSDEDYYYEDEYEDEEPAPGPL